MGLEVAADKFATLRETAPRGFDVSHFSGIVVYFGEGGACEITAAP